MKAANQDGSDCDEREAKGKARHMYTYIPRGVCSRRIDVELDGDIIKSVAFTGGCDGNLKAISKLVKGQKVDEVVEILQGNTCGPRRTSCADQLTRALREAQAAQ